MIVIMLRFFAIGDKLNIAPVLAELRWMICIAIFGKHRLSLTMFIFITGIGIEKYDLH